MGEFISVSAIPFMAKQWDDAKNKIDISTVSSKERNRNFFWVCKKCGYSWEGTPRSRFNAQGKCPCCDSGKAIHPGYNDVLTVVPDLAKSYDFALNVDIDIVHQGIDSKLEVFWKCDECGRSWKSSIRSRIKKVNGAYSVVPCPHYNISKRKAADVLTVSEHSGLFKFWDPANTLDPYTTRSNSPAHANWLCPTCHYKWSAAINGREKSSHQCPCCELNQVIQNGINDAFTRVPELALSCDFEKNRDVDISTQGIRSNMPLWWKCPVCGHEWQSSIASRINLTENGYTVRRCQECYFNDVRRITPVASIPALMRFWDIKKNREIGLDANLISAHSPVCAFWKCKDCGYEWPGSIKGRTGSDGKCPHCEKKLSKAVICKVNDVLTVVPELASICDFQWLEENEIDIYTLSPQSTVEIQFRCKKCERVWMSRIVDRIRKDGDGNFRLVGCSVCDNRAFRKETYAEQYPDLAAKFDDNLNGCSLASVKSKDSNVKKYWWHCDVCNRIFPSRLQSMIVARETKTKGCPFCAHFKLAPGESFADLHPECMNEYSPDNAIDPYTVFPNDERKPIWICQNNPEHTWSASFAQRNVGGGKCPICNHRIPIKGVNTFADTHKDLVAQWSPNNERSADETFDNASIWLKWICPTCNQEYGAYIKDVVSDQESCPYCANRKVLPGYNSLAVRYPEIAQMWSLNNEWTADEVLPSLTRRVLWCCPECGGEYSESIADMVNRTADCPYCSDQKVLPGYNSFAVKHPDLMAEWDAVNNYVLADPDLIGDSCNISVWWKCTQDPNHEFLMSPSRRLEFQKRSRVACPECKGLRRKKAHFI